MLNRVIIFGRICNDLSMKETNGETRYINFSIANDTGYGDNKKTNFIRCVAFKGTAETIFKYFTKGSLIGIEGTLTQDSYTDKDGNKKDSTQILVSNIQFCDGSKPSQNGSNNDADATGGNHINNAVGSRNNGSTKQIDDTGYFPLDVEYAPF